MKEFFALIVLLVVTLSGCIGYPTSNQMYRRNSAYLFKSPAYRHVMYQKHQRLRQHYFGAQSSPSAYGCESDPTCIRIVNRSQQGFVRCWLNNRQVPPPRFYIPLLFKQGMKNVTRMTPVFPPGYETRIYIDPGESYTLSCHLYRRVSRSPLQYPARRIMQYRTSNIRVSRFGGRQFRLGEEYMNMATSKYANE